MDEKSGKNTPKVTKREMIHITWRRDSCTKIRYIERIKYLQGVKIIKTFSNSLEDWRDLSLSRLSYTMKHIHTSQKTIMARGGRGMTECLIISTNPWGPIYRQTND
jgi:hypothetical protein